MMEVKSADIPKIEVTAMERPLVNDLVALFTIMADEAEKIIDRAVNEGWTPEQTIDEIDRLFAGDNRAPATEVRL